MAYIGNVPAEKYTALTQQTFSTPTGTSFTLSQAVTNSVDIDLYIDNVKQDPTTYSVSGTALTTSTIASPSTMYCIFNGRTTETVNPPDGSVGTAKVTDDAITLAKLAPGTDGNIISYDASGNPVAIATGSSGQVLTSGGAGAAPSFAAAPGGGLVFIAEVNVTSGDAAASFLSSFSSTYDDYIVYFDNMQVATDTALGSVRIAIGGAAKTDSTYAYGQSGLNEGGSEVYGANTASNLYRLSAGSWGNQATEVGAGWVTFHGVNAAVQKHLNSFTSFIDSNTTYVGSYGGCGYQGATTAWSGCQFLANGGNLISGNFKLFGIKNS
jgi:hypothetical protein